MPLGTEWIYFFLASGLRNSSAITLLRGANGCSLHPMVMSLSRILCRRDGCDRDAKSKPTKKTLAEPRS